MKKIIASLVIFAASIFAVLHARPPYQRAMIGRVGGCESMTCLASMRGMVRDFDSYPITMEVPEGDGPVYLWIPAPFTSIKIGDFDVDFAEMKSLGQGYPPIKYGKFSIVPCELYGRVGCMLKTSNNLAGKLTITIK